jgi:hypothetical protein
MSGEVQIKFPAQFSHSVKIEQSAKGARVTVHVLANSQQEAIDQAIQMYSSVRKRLEDEGHILSPIEVKESTTATTTTAATTEAH